MTEAEWQTSADPVELLRAVRERLPRAFGLLNPASHPIRKLTLFNTACCRGVWAHLAGVSKRAVEIMERFVEKEATRRDVTAGVEYFSAQVNVIEGHIVRGLAYQYGKLAFEDEFDAAAEVSRLCAALRYRGISSTRLKAQAELVRDIFEGVYRRITCDPSWLTSTVVALAEGVYRDGAFDRLPILADALMDAGCADDDVLNHCRGGRGDRGEPVGGSPHQTDGHHVRGCWVVDMLTGRA